MWNFLDRITGHINRAVGWVSSALFAVMLVIMLIQVFYRYVLRLGTPWAEEIALYMMVWLALLGASLIMREDRHVSINFMVRKLSARKAAVLKMVTNVIIVVFLFVLLREGWNYAFRFWGSMSPATGIRRTWAYLSLAAGSMLMLVQAFHVILIDARKMVRSWRDDGETEGSAMEGTGS